jgi:hypothetical protein
MANQEYMEKLRDPRWQRKRLEVLQAADWKCRTCGCSDRTLNVHHKKYRFGAEPWEYDIGELEVLCDTCHSKIHVLRKEICKLIEELSPACLESSVGYLTVGGEELGGTEWVQESADSDGTVDVRKMNDEQWEWWRITGNAYEERKKSEK